MFAAEVTLVARDVPGEQSTHAPRTSKPLRRESVVRKEELRGRGRVGSMSPPTMPAKPGLGRGRPVRARDMRNLERWTAPAHNQRRITL